MDKGRWERMQTLFHQAADLSADEQGNFLRRVCGDDRELLSDLQAMLEEDAQGASTLDLGVAPFAEQVLDRPQPCLQDFGPYHIKTVLGEGGMGVVYLAEREDLGNMVAVKILRDAWLSPARRERFTSEQRTLAQLNHPSIARIYDADTLPDGTPWFAMEYVEGSSLTRYCAEHHCSLERRLRLFRSVCEAVEYAHQSAVIHRDLKPSNILVKDDGTVRLLDFGIAKQIESLDGPTNQTMTGLRLMTPAYAAPEQVRGDHLGVHTDVYSLGVILYELLTGRLPFDLSNLTPAEAASVVVEHEPAKPSIAARRGLIPGGLAPVMASRNTWADLDVLCLTAMHKDSKRRYRSVEALVRDVDHYLNAEPLEARPDTLEYRLGKFIRRNRRSVAVATLVVALVIGLVTFFTVRLTRARNAAMAEAARTQRIQTFMLNLFQGGDESAGPADDLKVTTVVDRGVQEAQALTADPAVQAELYETLGTVTQNLGKFDQADKLLQSSLNQRRTLFGADSLEAADSLVALGMLRISQAKYDEAEQFVRQGLEIRKKKLPPNHPALAKATFALGKVQEGKGSYQEAIQSLEDAVRMQSIPGGISADLSSSLTELANCYFYTGNYAMSEALNQRILAMDRQLYGERHPTIADDLINLGALQDESGHYDAAERYYRDALDIIQSFYGKDHPETASAYTMLGRVMVSAGEVDEAKGLLEQALTIQEKVYGEAHPRVASILGDLGRVDLKQGKYDEAETQFLRMEDIYRKVYGDKHYYIAVAMSNLGTVYTDKKEYARAEQILRETVRRYIEALSPDHQYTGIARIKLGHVLLLQRRYEDAESESRAGYEIVKQAGGSPTWMKPATEDLIAEYTALHQPEKAAAFKAEVPTAVAEKKP